MKKINTLITALLSSLLLAGCEKVSPAHEHTFSIAWKNNENSHWHEATCEHSDLTKNMGSHTYGDDNICTVCGYEKIIPHEHSYSESWSNDSDSHWHQATCEHTDLTKDLAQHTYGDDNICTVCGYGKIIPHEHTFSDSWSNDSGSHWYQATCEHTDLTKDLGAHVDSNGDNVCDICLYNIEVIPEKYLVSFNTNFGSFIEPQIVVDGETITKPNNPTKENCAFYGWYDNPEFSGTIYDFSSKITSNTTLYARWGYSFTCINYDDSTYYHEVLLDGETINNIENPTKDNEVFIGWFENQNLEGEPFVFNAEIHENVTVYASFGYLVNFYTNNETIYKTVKVQEGKKVAVPTSPSKDFHDFDDWYIDTARTKKYNFNDAVNSSLNLYANFNVCSYTITYHNCDNASNTNPTTYKYGTGIETLADPVKKGYRFYGWYSDSGLKNRVTSISISDHGNVDLYAYFSIEYKVTFTNWPSGVTNPNPVSFTKEERQPLDLNPFKNYPGFEFVKYVDDKNKEHKTTDIDGNLSLKVVYNSKTIHLTFDANGGAVLGSENYIYLNTNIPGQQIEKYDIPKFNDTDAGFNPNTHVPKYDGHVFKGWYLDETLTTPINKNSTTYVTSGQTLYAKWEEVPTDYIDFNKGFAYEGHLDTPCSFERTQYCLIPYHVKDVKIRYEGMLYYGEVYIKNTAYSGDKTVDVFNSHDHEYLYANVENDYSNYDTFKLWAKLAISYNAGSCFSSYNYYFAVNSYREDYIKAKPAEEATTDVTYWNVIESPYVEREGYTFDGWFYNGVLVDFKNRFDIAEDEVTLVAHWTKN